MVSHYMIILFVWNIIVMFIYGYDKMLAKMRKRRISERTLLTCAFLVGGVGAMFGMLFFNHKTSKMKFRILVPIAVFISVAAIFWLRYLGIFK